MGAEVIRPSGTGGMRSSMSKGLEQEKGLRVSP